MKKVHDEIIIENLSQIDNKIRSLNIKAIGLNNKQDEELYLTLKILKTKMNQLNITLPFDILISDKPDIRIQTKNIKIGIEITFALNEAFQKAKRIRDKLDPSLILELSLHQIEKDKKNIENTIKKSNHKLFGSAFIDDEMEISISEIVINSINAKIKKYSDYETFNENNLFVYSDALLVDEKVLITLINEKLHFIDNIPFDKIVFRFQNKNHLLKYKQTV